MKRIAKLAAFFAVCVIISVAAAICMSSDYFAELALSELSLEQIEAYINERVIPIVVLVLTAIGTILMALLPLINKIKRSGDSFRSAEEGIKSTSADTLRVQKETKKLFEEMQAQIEQMGRLYEETDAKISEINQRNTKIEEIMRIGFCNTPSLVRNGYAKKICELTGEKNGKDKKA